MARKPRLRRGTPPRHGFFHRLRNDFLRGLGVVLPVFLTIYLVSAAVGFIDRQVVPLVPRPFRPDVVGAGLIIFIVFTTLVGALTKGIFGRQLINLGESIVDRMPIVRSIYNGLKQIVETVFSQTSTSFKTACLVEYPRKGVWAVAFLSTEAKGELPAKTEESDLVAVFLPTTPNPTSGFLLFLPRRDIIILDMTIEEAAKLIISAGLVAPPGQGELKPGRKVALAQQAQA